jgi:uncharacterized protein (TIGR03000 family)
MKSYWLTLPMLGLLGVSAQAGLFNEGIGGAMYYGPYTGGHAYSYNTAYGYGFSFSPADTWRIDPLAYPSGIYPYRPYQQPIVYRVFPNKEMTPYVSVPGPDGLPVLAPAPGAVAPPTVTLPPGVVPMPTPVAGAALAVPTGVVPVLQPVPVSERAETPATIRIRVPDGAEVWFDKAKTAQTGTDRVFQSPPVPAGKTLIYSVRARWNEGGREVEQFRVVGVRAGETARLTFTTARP